MIYSAGENGGPQNAATSRRQGALGRTQHTAFETPTGAGAVKPGLLAGLSQAELGGNLVPSGIGAVKPGLLYISGAWAVKTLVYSQARAAESVIRTPPQGRSGTS